MNAYAQWLSSRVINVYIICDLVDLVVKFSIISHLRKFNYAYQIHKSDADFEISINSLKYHTQYMYQQLL